MAYGIAGRLSERGLAFAASSDIDNGDAFKLALKVVLAMVALAQSNYRVTREQIDVIAAADPLAITWILNRLSFADIVTIESGYYLPSLRCETVSLAELYAAVMPVNDLPKTPLADLHLKICEENREVAMTVFKVANLALTIGSLMTTATRIHNEPIYR